MGILIDNNLSWQAHTNHITKIVSKCNGIIRKVHPFLNKDSLHTLYNQQLVVHMYRYHHDLLPPGLPNNKFTVQSDIHNTRQALQLRIDPTNTKLVKNTNKTQDPMIWSSINKNHKELQIRRLFQKKIP